MNGKDLREWLKANPTTTAPQETQHEHPSPRNSANTAAETEAQIKLLIGAILMQLNFTGQFARSLEQVVQSNLATPKTAEALSYALWEMVNLTMSTLDQLRTFQLISNPSLPTSLSDRELADFMLKSHEFLREIIETFGL